jgi:hypothetical protein
MSWPKEADVMAQGKCQGQGEDNELSPHRSDCYDIKAQSATTSKHAQAKL